MEVCDCADFNVGKGNFNALEQPGICTYMCVHYHNLAISVVVEDLKEKLSREQEEEESWRKELQDIISTFIIIKL